MSIVAQVKILYRKIREFGQRVANVLIYIILAIVYAVCITPFAIAIRLKDYLNIKAPPSWGRHRDIGNIPEFLRRQ